MKNKILSIFFLSLILAITLSSCAYSEMDATYDKDAEELPPSMFVEVENGLNYKIVYCKETKVMYAVADSYASGVFTLLVDANGKPMLYKGE